MIQRVRSSIKHANLSTRWHTIAQIVRLSYNGCSLIGAKYKGRQWKRQWDVTWAGHCSDTTGTRIERILIKDHLSYSISRYALSRVASQTSHPLGKRVSPESQSRLALLLRFATFRASEPTTAPIASHLAWLANDKAVNERNMAHFLHSYPPREHSGRFREIN